MRPLTTREKKYKQDHPFCEHCAYFRNRTAVSATELHHIEGRETDDESNLIHLCLECHREAEDNIQLYQAAHKWYKEPMNHMPDVSIQLPWQIVPASRPRSAVRNGKLMIYTQGDYAKFKRDFGFAAKKIDGFTQGCGVRIHYSAPDWKGFDCDNCAKGLLDAVSKADNRISRLDTIKTVTKEQPFIRMELWR